METPSLERLSSLDEWGDRKHIIPASVTGYWRTLRTRVYFVLLMIFLIAPWTKVNGLQTIWLDIPARRFTILGRVFLAHEAPMLFFIFGILVLGLALVTALWGRVWCGWACPQTVFIDTIYRRIETWIEGDYIKRRKLRTAPINFEKIWKGTLKWAAFIAVSSLIAHSFIAYFAGAEPLLKMVQAAPGTNWGYFIVVTFVTAVLAFDFGWFREQFCVIMCPYGRFQSVLMDEDSVTVVYDKARGEPRRRSVPQGQKIGDCVACNRCVEVCPTGIDIRNGTQMECIGCTACIDACNEMMERVKKPTNLIAYQNLTKAPARWKRPRVLVNIVLLALMTLGLSANLVGRSTYYASVLRAKDVPYQVLPNGEVINHFKLHLHNQSNAKQRFELALDPEWIAKGLRLTHAQTSYDILQGQDKVIHFFVNFPAVLTAQTGTLNLVLQVRENLSATTSELSLNAIGPQASNP
ncbi:MAG: cytochrome c oxidase accessory protein CcoG [Bdellovibrionales bacterium]